MICSICGGTTQPTFGGMQEHCRKCGTLHWIKEGAIHQSVVPFYWDDYSMDGEIFSMIRETLVAVGCLHNAEDGENAPPMMFNDWIRCAVAKREQRVKELQEKITRLEKEFGRIL